MRIFLILVFIASIVHADREGGPYLGIGYGVSEYNDGGLYASLKDNEVQQRYTYGGAYINKNFSVELGYVNMLGDGIKIDDTTNVIYSLYSVSTLAHYAFFDDILDFYAKFGTGYVQGYKDENGFSFVYGVGTSLRLTELLSIKVGYDKYEFGYDEDEDNSADYTMYLEYSYVAVEFQF